MRARAMMALLVMCLVGCSAPARYEWVRQMGESLARCDELPTAQAEADCRAAYAKDYGQYEQERSQL